jgi:hypothetical protein
VQDPAGGDETAGGNVVISDGLKEKKRQQQLETVARVTAAMKTIEVEVERDGFYAHNKCQITIKEVCRRAGVGQSTLKNSGHKDFYRTVTAWKAMMRSKVAILVNAPVSKRVSRKISAEQVDALQQLNAFKIMYDEMWERAIRLEEENAQLRKMLTPFVPNRVI